MFARCQTSAIAVHPDAGILVASDEGRHLLRVRVDAADPARVLATERLLQDRIGGIRAVAVGPEGGIYLATARTIWKPSGSFRRE